MQMIRRALLAFALMAGITPVFAQAPPPVPALPDTDRVTSYSISGTTCACNVNFALYGDSTDYQNWLTVWVNGVQVSYNDPVNGWAITSPTGPLATIPRPITDGVLTFTTAQTGTVQIVGARRPRRVSQFSENRGVAARDLNQALTDIVAQNRETWDLWERSLVFEPGFFPNALPLASARAGLYFCFAAVTGQPTTCAGAGGGGANISAGNGIAFTGSNPTTISTNVTGGNGIAVAPSGSASQVSLGNIAADTAWCNPTGSTAAPQQCTAAQLASLGLAQASFVNSFTANHTIATTDCGGTVQMGAGSTGQLTLTLPSVSGFSGACPIEVLNGDTYSAGNSRGKIMSGFPSDVFYILFPKQSFGIKIIGGAWVVTRAPGRWIQTGPQLYAANSGHGGSDTTSDCLSLTHPCQTIANTASIVYSHIDVSGSNPTIFLNAGDSFHECVTLQGQLTGFNFGLIASTGGAGGSSWGNVTGACSGNSLLTIADNAEWQIQNIEMLNPSGTSGIDGIHMHQTGVVDVLGGMAFGSFPGATAIGSDNNSMINMTASYTIEAGGTTPVFFGIGPATTLNECGACTTTFTTSPTITTMYAVNGAGASIVFGSSHSFSGTANITNACSVSGPSMIAMASNTLPGTTACTSGSASHGGQVF